MKRLELELFRYKMLVFGSVTQMDESLRSEKCTSYKVLAMDKETGFEVRSSNSPQLDKRLLYVRGAGKSWDDAVFFYEYDNEEEAIEACEAIERLVNEINSKTLAKPDFRGPIVQVLPKN